MKNVFSRKETVLVKKETHPAVSAGGRKALPFCP